MPRGGRRPGAGAPSKPLVDKILEGNPGKRPLKRLEFPESSHTMTPLSPPASLPEEGKRIYLETSAWLEGTGCLALILPSQLEEYAMCKARWLECEERNSAHGLIAKHPTTGQPIQSPFVSMAVTYLKQADAVWQRIYDVVKENCTEEFRVNMPHADVMECLLTMKRK